MRLPEKYCNEMKELLGSEYEKYLACFDQPPVSSLRINTGKISVAEFLAISPFHLTPVPWCSSGFYFDENERPGKHPYYYAGLYYIQEASAMTPAEVLPVNEGDVVLDACCAPGGKSTALVAKLNGSGLLVANDISASRQNATLKNLERHGFVNIYVTCTDLKRMAEQVPESFDKILLDVPCSGEGMFRKDPALIAAWEEKGPDQYVPVQKEIVTSALKLLKPGGMMVYSTCTFSVSEDEEIIRYMMSLEPHLKLMPIPDRCELFQKGIGEGMENCARLYPHHLSGEGHFTALLKKEGIPEPARGNAGVRSFRHPELDEFLSLISFPFEKSRITLLNDRILYLPEIIPSFTSIRTLRSGLLLGTLKKNHFEPSQHLAQFLKPGMFRKEIHLSETDVRIGKYLRGETIRADEEYNGWVCVCANRYPLGFGKQSDCTVKNKIEKGYRII